MVPPQLSVALAVAVQASTVAGLKHSIVNAAAGTVTTGGVMSLTRKSLGAVPILPQASVAVNVTVTVRLQLSIGAVEVGTPVMVPPHLSVALAVAVQASTVAGLKHSIVNAAAGTVTTGGVMSLTRKSLVAVPILPQASVAVNVTVTVRVHLSIGAV